MKPLIGITCNYSLDDKPGVSAHIGVAGQKWQMLADNYIDSVFNAGGIPVIIPISENLENLSSLVEKLDGILISGGNDIEPNLYGEFISKEVGVLCPKRDKQEIELVNYIIENTNKPLLGICRGLQILNVACGGNLYQDLEKNKLNNHFIASSPMNHPIHRVTLEKDSILYDIFEKKELKVNSYHHQAIKELGKNLKCTAVSEDGIIESIEVEGKQFMIATQWHPEMMYDSKEQQNIFKRFIKEASK